MLRGGRDRGFGQERFEARAVCKDAMVSNGMSVRSWNEGGQAAEEVQGLEHQAGHPLSMRPGPAQVIEDASIVSHGQSLLGEGGSESIAAEPLQSVPVLGRDGLCRVEREAGHACAERLRRRLGALSGEAELGGRYGQMLWMT